MSGGAARGPVVGGGAARGAARGTARAAIVLGVGGVLAVGLLLVTGTQAARLLVLIAVLVVVVAVAPRRWALGAVALAGAASIVVFGGVTLFVIASAVEGVAGTPPPDLPTFAVGATAALVCWTLAVGLAALDLARGRWRALIIAVTAVLAVVPVAWWLLA
ncbi:MAG: hypothetical protein JJT89_14855 [Nitriliruptoraceae bacterium]|nr:hypothetical protein [Nitriliruptoraceae bacterium]